MALAEQAGLSELVAERVELGETRVVSAGVNPAGEAEFDHCRIGMLPVSLMRFKWLTIEVWAAGPGGVRPCADRAAVAHGRSRGTARVGLPPGPVAGVGAEVLLDVGDAESLPYADDAFDVVTSSVGPSMRPTTGGSPLSWRATAALSTALA